MARNWPSFVNTPPQVWRYQRSTVGPDGTVHAGTPLPGDDPATLVHQLYRAENKDKPEPSGSQDMIGLIYPGVNRLDYDFAANGGVFPAHIESLNDARAARWLEQVIQVLPVAPRPEGYNPIGEKHLNPKWVARLGQTGKDCFEAIRRQSLSQPPSQRRPRSQRVGAAPKTMPMTRPVP